jgi:O-antigen/teichoic acid export membrane protein
VSFTRSSESRESGIAEPDDDIAREPIRGSSLLLLGRLVSLGVMCAVQILVVRHLSRTDYGAWTYALSVVTLLQSVAALGLDRSVTRFLAIYRERGDLARVRGLVVLLVGVVAAFGTVLTIVLVSFPDVIARLTGVEPHVLALLNVIIFLVPLEALDLLFIGLFACLGQARAIVVRRHILSPCLKLGAVIALVTLDADVTFLAYGYLAASLTGMLLYAPLVWRSARQLGLTVKGEQRHDVTLPAGEVFAFTLPLVTADVAAAIIWTAGTLVLGYYSTLEQVALFTVAVPLATLNETVARNFTVLYTPVISRLYARQDHSAINTMYWRTAAWVAVLTFPVFVLTFAASGSVLHVFYGAKYHDAALVLSLLAFGEYVNVALGLNGLTLRLLSDVRYSVTLNIVAAVVAVAANVMLVPRYGALGAAYATAGTAILHCVLKQIGLARATGVSPFELRFSPLYAGIALGAIVVVCGEWVMPERPIVLFALAASASLMLLIASKRMLMVTETFPEVKRVPWIGALFA